MNKMLWIKINQTRVTELTNSRTRGEINMFTSLPNPLQEKIKKLLMADDFVTAKRIYDEWKSKAPARPVEKQPKRKSC